MALALDDPKRTGALQKLPAFFPGTQDFSLGSNPAYSVSRPEVVRRVQPGAETAAFPRCSWQAAGWACGTRPERLKGARGAVGVQAWRTARKQRSHSPQPRLSSRVLSFSFRRLTHRRSPPALGALFPTPLT